MKKLHITALLLAMLLLGLVSSCNTPQASPKRVYKLGVTGTDFEIWEDVSRRLESRDIVLEIISFSDYVKPNIALAEKEIDLNAFQTEIYFRDFIAARDLKLSLLGYTVVAPMGIYSGKISSMDDLPSPAVVAIPNDLTNGGRALKFLESLGLLDVSPEAGLTPTVQDITAYHHDLDLVEMNATQIPRSLQDLDVAVINNGVAYEAGLSLAKDALIYEDPEAPHMKNYWNIIAVRSEDATKEDFKTILASYQHSETKALIDKKYGGQNIPVFSSNDK